MAYKNNLLEYYGGGSVPYSQGYQGGGLMGNSLLGMQTGGAAGVARARKILAARKDVESRARKIRRKQGKSGFWGKIGNIGGKALATAAMAAFAPATGGASLLFAKSLGSGLGSYVGARAGYGDKVGSGAGGSKWLAGSRRKLGSAEEGLEKSFKERGLASGAATFAMGAIEGELKDLGDKFKPDVGKTPMGGDLSLSKPPAGDLSKAYAGSPEGYVGGVPGAETLDYKPSGLGAGVGSKALGDKPLIGGSDFSKQLSEPYADSPAGYGVSQGAVDPFDKWKLPGSTDKQWLVPETESLIGGAFEPLKEEIDPLSALDEELYGMDWGQNVGIGVLGSQRGGHVSGRHGGYTRNDMALLDMIYRR